jgi:hypothetical protein
MRTLQAIGEALRDIRQEAHIIIHKKKILASTRYRTPVARYGGTHQPVSGDTLGIVGGWGAGRMHHYHVVIAIGPTLGNEWGTMARIAGWDDYRYCHNSPSKR